jgi:Protein ENHANCED DISEASE RESISTANCE 2, C-terminal
MPTTDINKSNNNNNNNVASNHSAKKSIAGRSSLLANLLSNTSTTSCGFYCGEGNKYDPVSSPLSNNHRHHHHHQQNQQQQYSQQTHINDSSCIDLETDNMRHSSISRRADRLQSPPIRSRSAERSTNTNDGTNSSIMSPNMSHQHNNNNNNNNSTSEEEDSNQLHVIRAVPQFPLDRAVSDLYDAQEQDDDTIMKRRFDTSPSTDVVTTTSTTTTTTDSSIYNNSKNDTDTLLSLPTLPRYPVAETRNKNCWSSPPVSIFSVRGPHYFTDKKKITSSAYLFETRGSDIFLADDADAVYLSRM